MHEHLAACRLCSINKRKGLVEFGRDVLIARVLDLFRRKRVESVTNQHNNTAGIKAGATSFRDRIECQRTYRNTLVCEGWVGFEEARAVLGDVEHIADTSGIQRRAILCINLNLTTDTI